MKYVCSRAQQESDIWMTPLGITDLQFHRLGSSSFPISLLADPNNSSRCVWETEPEIRALLVDMSSSEGRTCRWVNYSRWRQFSSRWNTDCKHFSDTFTGLFFPRRLHCLTTKLGFEKSEGEIRAVPKGWEKKRSLFNKSNWAAFRYKFPVMFNDL